MCSVLSFFIFFWFHITSNVTHLAYDKLSITLSAKKYLACKGEENVTAAAGLDLQRKMNKTPLTAIVKLKEEDAFFLITVKTLLNKIKLKCRQWRR